MLPTLSPSISARRIGSFRPIGPWDDSNSRPLRSAGRLQWLPAMRIPAGSRERALLGLVLVHIAVAAIAYTDVPSVEPAPGPPLTDLEREGLAIWRARNCQACHQIHGFGGFLGPDLTNRVGSNSSDEEFRAILVDGAGSMPAFRMGRDERRALLAWLRAIDRTGRSQPPALEARRDVPPAEHWRLLVEEWLRRGGEAPGHVADRGLDLWTRTACGACHTPFKTGKFGAPDLTRATLDRSAVGLRRVVTEGRRNMPSHALSDEELDELAAFLGWIADRRRELARVDDALLQRAEFSWEEVPWFEYR